MSQPKKKTSRSRRDMRRHGGHTHQLASPTLGAACPECGASRRPHGVCKCGYYNGRQVLPPPRERGTGEEAQA